MRQAEREAPKTLRCLPIGGVLEKSECFKENRNLGRTKLS